MTAKVDETLSKIPVLKVNLDQVFDFKDKCIDQLAIDIITESIDYALETSVRRLESVAKINPSIRDNATQTILPAIKTLRNLIENAPACASSALGGAPIKSPPRPKPEKPVPLVKPTPKTKTETKTKDHVANISKAVAKAKTPTPPTKSTEIDYGRVFEVAYDNEPPKKYLIVQKQSMKNPKQVPREEGVEKLSGEGPLGKLVMGKKTGDTIEIEGAKVTIKDVREGGHMKILGIPATEGEDNE